MKTDVSIIYTIFNIELKEEYFISLKSNLLQKNVNKEIIVVEQNQVPTKSLKDFCNENNIKYIYVSSTQNYNNIGYLKNLAILNSSGEYLYFNDLDVVFINENYLSKLVQYMKEFEFENMVRPKMLRLIDNHKEFCKDYPFVEYKNTHKCFANYKNKVVDCNKKESYALINNLMHVKIGANVNQEFNDTKIENFNWQLNFHCGGLICKASLVHKIGGFSLSYIKWGMDDIDFQWRLNEFYGTRYINDCVEDSVVLHLEHPSRAENELYKKNREVFAKRRENGLLDSIKTDLQNFNQMKETIYESK